MPLWASFVGPAYRVRSENLNAEQLINAYVETITASGNAKKSNFYGTPGLKLFLTIPTTGSRGAFDQDGLTLFVVGDRLYSLNLVLSSATDLGEILNDGKPVSFASNGRGGEQVAICGGGQVKILDLLTMTLSAAVVLPLTNAPVQIAFIDGYFLLLEANTIRVWFSNLEDGLIWDSLDFFARSQTSDNLVGIKVLRDKIWTFGSLTTEVFYDAGDNDNRGRSVCRVKRWSGWRRTTKVEAGSYPRQTTHRRAFPRLRSISRSRRIARWPMPNSRSMNRKGTRLRAGRSRRPA